MKKIKECTLQTDKIKECTLQTDKIALNDHLGDFFPENVLVEVSKTLPFVQGHIVSGYRM